jgi:anthranilate phosphoribosyltransferase
MNPTDILYKLVQKKNLSAAETSSLLKGIMGGTTSPVLTAAILTALRMKGETTEEVVGLVQAMRGAMVPVNAPEAMDIVGTGGDGSGTFNISTTTAFVVAGAGVKVAKHGNRAASSKCGSADVLEALGVNINLTALQAQEIFRKVGFVFMLAPLFHPATKNVVIVRKELKIRTIFNILGPFANPASTKFQLTGVPDMESARRLALVAKVLGYTRNLIVTSGGTDELTLNAKTIGYEIVSTKVKKVTIDPQKLGFKKAPKNALLGGDAAENAHMLRSILNGERGPRRDVVILNAGCALYVAGKAATIKGGIKQAGDSIDSGAAARVLEQLVFESQKIA